MPDGALLELVGSLYEVATSPPCWQVWLTRLCDVLAVQAGVLVARFEPNVGDRGVFVAGLPDLMVEDRPTPPSATYLRYLAEDSRLFRRALALREGELLILSEVLSREDFVATRFYREWLRPRELHHVLALIVSRTPRYITGLTVLRRPERPAFASVELGLLRRLLPHLQRVVQLQEMLAEAELRYELAQQVLESLRCGAILVDGRGRVCGVNERAAALLERKEGVRLERAELQAEDPRETAALRRLVRAATGEGGARSGGVLALSRTARHRALVVSVSPLQQMAPRMSSLPVARALVRVSDPDEFPALHEPALQTLYGLTQAEARVASRLAHGETVDEIAASLGVRRATVRTHLQQVLDKTGTHRQADLVRLLLMGNPGLAAPGSLYS